MFILSGTSCILIHFLNTPDESMFRVLLPISIFNSFRDNNVQKYKNFTICVFFCKIQLFKGLKIENFK